MSNYKTFGLYNYNGQITSSFFTEKNYESVINRENNSNINNNINSNINNNINSNINNNINNNSNINNNINNNSNINNNINNNSNINNNINPTVFGPHMWKMYHNMAIRYPDNPSSIYKTKMEHVIKNIPLLLSCDTCKNHASVFIDINKDNIGFICSSKTNLFNFFVDFHNTVNKRLNKETITYEEAMKLYK
jgi:hypothetical protein